MFFGGLGRWAIVAIALINRRHGAWEKPERQPLAAELKPLLAAIVVYVVLRLVHPLHRRRAGDVGRIGSGPAPSLGFAAARTGLA